jgi:3-phytase
MLLTIWSAAALAAAAPPSVPTVEVTARGNRAGGDGAGRCGR